MKASLAQSGFSAVNSENEVINFSRYSISIIIFERKIIINIDQRRGKFLIEAFESICSREKIPTKEVNLSKVFIRKLEQYQHAQSSLGGALSELIKVGLKRKTKQIKK